MEGQLNPPFQEPPDATPLDADDILGLRIPYILTRQDLNVAEQSNILKAMDWASRKRETNLLSESFVVELHRRMFGDVWHWAGTYRTRGTNIGVTPHDIPPLLRELLDDARYWLNHASYAHDELALRLHHRMVQIHPFPNGNGRHTRLMADLQVQTLGEAPFTWGHGDLNTATQVRSIYIQALRSADNHDIKPLLAFARS